MVNRISKVNKKAAAWISGHATSTNCMPGLGSQA